MQGRVSAPAHDSGECGQREVAAALRALVRGRLIAILRRRRTAFPVEAGDLLDKRDDARVAVDDSPPEVAQAAVAATRRQGLFGRDHPARRPVSREPITSPFRS